MPIFTHLKITVYENGHRASLDDYSGQELAALEECIWDLWSPTYHSTRSFEVDFGDDDAVLIYCDSETKTLLPIPEDWMTKTIRFGLKTDLKLVGDRLPIKPRQLGLSPWPASVHVQFTPE